MDARRRGDQSFHRVSNVGLLSDKAEIPDVLRIRGIMQVVDLHVLVGTALVPAGREIRSGARQRAVVCDQKRYAGIALPPALVSVGELWCDGGQQYRVGWIRDVEYLVRFCSGVSRAGRGSAAPQQVVVAMLPRRLCRAVGRQYVPAAHMCHLVTGGIERATRPRDMRQINRVTRVGHIQNGSSVSLAGESQPVNGRASMVSHVRDVATALANDERRSEER